MSKKREQTTVEQGAADRFAAAGVGRLGFGMGMGTGAVGTVMGYGGYPGSVTPTPMDVKWNNTKIATGSIPAAHSKSDSHKNTDRATSAGSGQTSLPARNTPTARES